MTFGRARPKNALIAGRQSPREIVLSGKIMRIRANSAPDSGHLTQITVDSFFNYLYYPTQSLAFTPTETLRPEMESRNAPAPFIRWGCATLSAAVVPFGSRP